MSSFQRFIQFITLVSVALCLLIRPTFALPTEGKSDKDASQAASLTASFKAQELLYQKTALTGVPEAPRRDRSGGPDNFGYRWRDNENGAEYDWIDITQGEFEGEVVQGVGDDDSHGPFELGWTFNFYGNDFHTFRVVSNGWISFTNEGAFYNVAGENADFPHAGGYPENVISPFMTDLINAGGTPLRWYTNADERWAVIAWDDIRSYGDHNLAYHFEIILHGNGKIKFQYQTDQTVDNQRQVLSGIQNANRDDGLTVFRGQGAGAPTDEYAVEFIKSEGWVTGTVTSMGDDQPIQGATVRLSDGSSAQTNADGIYWLNEVAADADFTISCAVDGYNPYTSDQFHLDDQDTATVDIALTHPEIRLDVDRIGADLRQHGVEEQTFNIINDGNGPLEYSMRFSVPRQRDELGDVVFDFNASQVCNDQRIRGVTVLGQDIFLSGSNNAAEPNYIYVFNSAGELQRRFEQPVQNNSSIGLKGLTNDGTYIYGADTRTIVKFTTDGERVGTINGPLNPSRYLAYDPATDHFWACDVTSPLYEIDRGGNIIHRIDKPMRSYGLAWHPEDLDSCYLYVFHRITDGAQLVLSKMNPVTGRIVELAQLDFTQGDVANGIAITNSFNPLIWMMVGLVENQAPDRVVGAELSLNTSWISIHPMAATVQGGSWEETTARFDAGNWIPGEYNLLLVIATNASQNRVELPISMSVSNEGFEPQHFSFHRSEVQHSFSVTALQIRGEDAAWGDEVGIYDGNGLCVGASLWYDQMTQMYAFADDPATDAVDGYTAGHQFSFKVWDVSIEREFAADATIASGDQTFAANGRTRLGLSVPGSMKEVNWSLPLGWSSISSGVIADRPDLATIMGDLVANGSLAMVKDGFGHFFTPRNHFNNIGDWVGTAGYMVKLTTPSRLSMTGEALAADHPISLDAGWNMVAYLPATPIEAIAAFAGLGDNLLVVKDGEGRFILPQYNFSNMGNALPGNGYQVKVTNAAELRYPNRGQQDAIVELLPLVHTSKPASTGSNMSLLVTGRGILRGTEIIAQASDGSLVGAGVAEENGRVGLAVWGDDPTTAAHDGLSDKESFALMIWSDAKGWTPINSTLVTGEQVFTADAITVINMTGGILAPASLQLDGIWPNPFNSIASIRYEIPVYASVAMTLHSLDGRQVKTLYTGNQDAGAHTFTIDAADLASGTYLLRLGTGGESRVAKIVLVR